MECFLYHLQINVSDSDRSFKFYKDLLGYVGYKVTYEGKEDLGMSNGRTDLWFMQTPSGYKTNKYHRKNTGINHIALGVSSKEAVDNFCNDFLKVRNIPHLYDSPREYPEYEKGYYAVFFEDPDRIKIEVVYIPGFENRI